MAGNRPCWGYVAGQHEAKKQLIIFCRIPSCKQSMENSQAPQAPRAKVESQAAGQPPRTVRMLSVLRLYGTRHKLPQMINTHPYSVTVFYIFICLAKICLQKQISAEQLLERDSDPPQKPRRNPAETAETNSTETPAETPQKPPQKQTAETKFGPNNLK